MLVELQKPVCPDPAADPLVTPPHADESGVSMLNAVPPKLGMLPLHDQVDPSVVSVIVPLVTGSGNPDVWVVQFTLIVADPPVIVAVPTCANEA